MSKIVIYDTTLRDGTQREGISLSIEDKIRIAEKLDALGMTYIEGGWPGSNPKDSEFFAHAKNLKLKNAKLTAFGSTRRPNSPTPDATLTAIASANTEVVAIFGKSWRLHVEKVLNTTLEENLLMIRDSVAYFKANGREMIYDAEHFFDGYKDSPDYAMATLRAAAEAGADCIALCDTNGGALPSEVSEITARVVAEFARFSGREIAIGIHAHNDADLAVANSIAAVQAGATHVQGTINGYGERTGNANLCSIIPNIELKLKKTVVGPEKLRTLTEVSHFVSEIANLAHDSHLPYVGTSSFAHKAGMHVNAVLKAAESFEHIKPELVGNLQRVLISELSGKSNILFKAQQFGLDLTSNDSEVRRVVERIKDLENQGFLFEAAEASFELLVRRIQPGYKAPFTMIDMLVLVESRRESAIFSEATVKIKVGDEVYHTASEGNGPVNALDRSVRKALAPVYPILTHSQLSDYKVRVLDTAAGTDAMVRVTIETTDGHRIWNTMGSSSNVIGASWLALSDSLEYAILKSGNSNGHNTSVDQPNAEGVVAH